MTTLYTNANCLGLFLRFASHLKKLPFEHRVVTGSLPSELAQINPRGELPFFLDKNLALCGDALTSYIHERYPSPALLPAEPVPRAQVRMLANQVIETYPLADYGSGKIIPEVEDIIAAYNPEFPYFANSPVITLVDVAIAPLLYRAEQLRIFEPFRSVLNHYYYRLTRTPAFQSAALINLAGGLDGAAA